MIETTPYDEKLKPLFGAIEVGNIEQVKAWIAAGEPLLNPKSRSPSALVVAAEAGFFSMVELLLSVDGWIKYPRMLNAALRESIRMSHVDNVKILLDNGADPNSVDWYSVFATHKRDIVTTFLEHEKSVDDIGEGIEVAEWGTARALREWLEHDKTPEIPLLRKMISVLDEIYENSTFYMDRNDEIKQHEGQNEIAKHAEKVFALIRWTGVDTRRKFDLDGQEDSVYAAVVRKGTRNQLRSLGREEKDADLLNAAATDMEWCDEAKADYMFKIGLTVNDRADGTSSLLLSHFGRQNESVVMYLAEHGARLPEIDEEMLDRWRNHFYKYAKPRPGILLSLARILTSDQMSLVIRGQKIVEVFGSDERTILDDLYDADKTQSPDAFAKHMEQVKISLKGAAIHPLARNFRGYCMKSDRTPYPQELVRFVGHQVAMCNFRGNECSKEIRPWIICVLNQFIPKCIARGAKFRFEEIKERYTYRNERPDVDFIAHIDGYDVPLLFKEGKSAPKAHLLRKPVTGEVYSGKLQFCHRLDRRICSPEVILKERSFLWFENHIDDMVEGLFSVVEKKKRADEREKERQDRLEKERRKREDEAREREDRRRAEEHAREEDARRRREEEAALAARRLAEEKLFESVVAKAQVLDDCRRVRAYLEDVRRAAGVVNQDEKLRIDKWMNSVESILCKKERWGRDPFSVVVSSASEESRPVEKERIETCHVTSPERNYWASRGWWNKR